MIISTSILRSAIRSYNRKRKIMEHYSKSQAANAGLSAAFDSFVLLVSLLFFVLELLVLYYSIGIAISCTKGGPERIVHIVLATIFTLPYILLNVIFNKCANSNLRSENITA